MMPLTLLGRCAVVAGARHRSVARNCQDAAATWVAADQRWGLAVVCDGCGSQPASEFGALWGRLAWQQAVQRAIGAGIVPTACEFWPKVCADVAAGLAALAQQCSSSEVPTISFVHEHLLFTSLVAVMYDQTLSVFALGDGTALVAGQVHQFGPWPDNAPPYLAYALLDPTFAPAAVATTITCNVEATGIVAIASDGIDDFPGGIEALVIERNVRNPDGLRRTLELAARPSEQIDWPEQRVMRIAGRLHDDTAVAVLQWATSNVEAI